MPCAQLGKLWLIDVIYMYKEVLGGVKQATELEDVSAKQHNGSNDQPLSIESYLTWVKPKCLSHDSVKAKPKFFSAGACTAA